MVPLQTDMNQSFRTDWKIHPKNDKNQLLSIESQSKMAYSRKVFFKARTPKDHCQTISFITMINFSHPFYVSLKVLSFLSDQML